MIDIIFLIVSIIIAATLARISRHLKQQNKILVEMVNRMEDREEK